MKKKCEVCGRETNRTHSLYGYKCVCSKHMHQILNYGHPIDTIQRTNSDLNDYIIKGKEVIFNVYNQKNEKNAEFIIDKEDIEKVKYHKWRLSHKHVVTGLPSRGNQRDLSWIILDIPSEEIKKQNIVIDHKDGDPLNNKKDNLRICKQSQNSLNKSFMSNNTSGFIGVTYIKNRGYYDPEIRLGYKRCHLGRTKIIEEAVYRRYCAEQILFQDFANKKEQRKKEEFTKNISPKRKEELKKNVEQKLKDKGLWR